MAISDGSCEFILNKYSKLPISIGGTDGSSQEESSQNLNLISYRKVDSIKSLPGSFWVDHLSGVPVGERPSDWSDTWDYIIAQFSTLAGNDKTQIAFQGGDIYLRGDDNGLGSETWTQQSWKKFTTSFIVSYYRSGYNWYRVWSNGMIEQGGTFGANNGGWTSTTFNFLKSFSNNNYILFCKGNWSNGESTSCKITARTASSATVTHANNLYSTYPSVYYAWGY